MKRVAILLAVLTAGLLIVLVPNVSQGVPSFSRQVQKPCTACHTIWPNLNQYGRQFKVKAYTDVSPEWKLEKKDGLNLLYIFPLSVRITSFLYTREDDDQADVHKDSTRIPDELDLFLASRVYDYAGVFAFGAWNPDDGWTLPQVKLAAQYPLGEGNTIGLVAFKGPSTAVDPFTSFGGRDRPLTFGDESTPLVLTKGWTFSPSDEGNMGVVAQGYFWGNRIYAAAGGMRGGRSEDVSGGNLFNAAPGANIAESNPIGGYGRLAWDQKLPNGAVTFGGAYYNGNQRIIQSTALLGLPYEAKVERIFVDASLEQNLWEDFLLEFHGLYGWGTEKNVFGANEERKFEGFYLEASLYYQRKYGLVGAYNHLSTNGVSPSDVGILGAGGDADIVDSWVASATYLPWANTKLALQYAQILTKFVGGQPYETDNRFRVVVDLLF